MQAQVIDFRTLADITVTPRKPGVIYSAIQAFDAAPGDSDIGEALLEEFRQSCEFWMVGKEGDSHA
jgi:hypothetical protein